MNTSHTFHSEYAWFLIMTLLAAFVALFLSLQAGFFILLFSILAWYAWGDAENGFLLLLILAPILPMFKITQTLGTFSLVKDVLILTLFFHGFLLPLLQKRLQYRRNILFAPIVALVAWASFELLRADSLILGVLRLRDIVLYMLAYFAVLYLPRHDEATMQRRAKWFLAGVGITLLLAVWQWFFAVDSAVLRFDPIREIWIPRLSSVLAHPSIYGQYLITALSLTAAFAFVSKKARWYAAIASAAILPAAFLTYSRSVWLGSVVAIGSMLALIAWNLFRSKVNIKRLGSYGALIVVTAVVVVGILAKTTPAGGLLRSIFDPTYGSNEERVEFLVRLVAPLTTMDVIIGNGLGDVLVQNFRQVDLQAYDIAAGASRAVQLTKNTTLVDNQHLKTFIEMGVVGLALYIWLYARIVMGSLRLVFQSTVYQQIIGMWGIGFLAAFLLQAFFIDIWDIFPTNLFFWIIAALISQAALKPAPPATPRVG